MAIMSVKLFAGFIGLSERRVEQLIRNERITGLTVFNQRFKVIDTTKAKILPNPNFDRRTTGHVIGRSKKLKHLEE